MRFGMEKGHEHTYTLSMNIACRSPITNIVMGHNSEVDDSERYIGIEICATEIQTMSSNWNSLFIFLYRATLCDIKEDAYSRTSIKQNKRGGSNFG
jgi:hypothetical protein